MKLNYVNKIKANIAIYSNKKTNNILDGTYKSIYRGKSMNFENLREYVINDVISSLEHIKSSDNTLLIEKDYLKLVKKYQNKYKDKELERKVIESLLVKGYNYKSVKEYIGGIPHD